MAPLVSAHLVGFLILDVGARKQTSSGTDQIRALLLQASTWRATVRDNNNNIRIKKRLSSSPESHAHIEKKKKVFLTILVLKNQFRISFSGSELNLIST